MPVRLVDVIERVGSLGERECICARRPWTPDSEATVVMLDEDGRLPDGLAAGMEYFLEASSCAEVLEVLDGKPHDVLTSTRLLIHYAEHDAFPDWVHAR